MQHRGSSLFMISMAVFACYAPGAFADRCWYKQNYSNSVPQAGEWCEKGLSCPPGCYCTGYAGSDYKEEIWEENSSKNPFKSCSGCITNGIGGRLKKLCKNSFKADGIYDSEMRALLQSYIDYVWPQSERYNLNNETNNEKNYKNYERIANSLGIFACPSDYPYSDKGAKKKTDCYRNNGSTKEYKPLQQKCEKGNFPGGLTANCVACNETNTSKLSGGKLFKDRFPGYICPGGEHDRNSDPKNWLEKCTSGKMPNADFTKCVEAQVQCSAGKYVPKGKSTCEPCKTDSNRYYCPGLKLTALGAGGVASTNYGLKSCIDSVKSDGTVVYNKANTARTACVIDAIQCKPGKFLPAGVDICKDCREDHACAGGKWKPDHSNDMGIVACDPGFKQNLAKTSCISLAAREYTGCAENVYNCIKNAAKTEGFEEGGEGYEAYIVNELESKCSSEVNKCYSSGGIEAARKELEMDESLVGTKIPCAPGKYLPANEIKCKLCDGVNKYCVGGAFDKETYSSDRGIDSCPFGSSVNAKKTGCSIKLTKDVMYYGTTGKGKDYTQQCWSEATITEYMNCVFSIKA